MEDVKCLRSEPAPEPTAHTHNSTAKSTVGSGPVSDSTESSAEWHGDMQSACA